MCAPLAALVLLVLASITPALRAVANPATDAFVLAGQSNAVGWSTQNEDALDGRVTSPNPAGLVSMSFRMADHRWVLANEFPCADSQCTGTSCALGSPPRSTALHPQPTDQGAGTCVCDCGIHRSTVAIDTPRGSPWPGFAARWMQERGRELRFVAAAVGGQCLVASPSASQPAWDPDAMDCATLAPAGPGQSPPSFTAPGEAYCRMLEAVTVSGVGELRAVLWHQGECDAQQGVSREAYRAALEGLADAIWSDLGVPLIAAPIGTNEFPDDLCTQGARLAAIHDATIDAAAVHAHIQLGPDVDDLELEPGCSHVHDVALLGQRWFEAVTAAPAAACENGADDDADGFADYPADPGCATPIATLEDPACQDGVDGDGDGRIDFDGGASHNGGTPLTLRDPQCTTAFGATELGRTACGLGAETLLVLAPWLRRRARA